MSLRNLSLKEIYRSDRDDIISEFFVPCLANCIEYSRCVERISAKSLTTIILAIGDDPDTRVRIVSGHRFGAGDIALMNKIFSKDGNRIVNDFTSLIQRSTGYQVLPENLYGLSLICHCTPYCQNSIEVNTWL